MHNSLPPVKSSLPEIEQIHALVHRLIELGVDRSSIQVVKAPLRICPLGAHIDHQLGIVTGMTIDQSVLLAFAPTEDGSVYVESQNFPGAANFGLSEIPPRADGDWANYVRGAANSLQQQYRLRKGIVGVIGGAMPIGGLSSSAAVTTAYLLAIETVNELALSGRENVEMCRLTENGYIGLNNGILDQSVILFSELDHLTRIDCETVKISQLPAPSSNNQPYEILVVYSGVSDSLTGTDYNNRVAECRSAAGLLLKADGRSVPEDARLRHVPPAVFEAYGATMPDALKRRAKHFFGEMDRVAAGEVAWSNGDMETFGRLVNESGESSVRWYECGSPQLITLYEILRDTPGVYGTRFSGAGFRGSCVALIDPSYRELIAGTIHDTYPTKHPEEAAKYSIHFCHADGGARLLNPSQGEQW